MTSSLSAVRFSVLSAVCGSVPALACASALAAGQPDAAQTREPLSASEPVAPSADAAPAAPAAEAPKGLLPIPTYSGDFWSRDYLTGDWNGARTSLAEKGVQFEFLWGQYVQGVASGGRDTDTRYGGHLDYLMTLDLMRMGVLDGALISFRAETRYGESVNGIAGPILPVNTDAYFPIASQLDEDIPFTITNLNYTQFLSPQFAVFLGKIDTLSGDPNEFASGRGTSQFMNANFVFNASIALRLPYSTLGAGVSWTANEHFKITSTIMNTPDSSTTSGFDDFGDGLTWTTEANMQYRLGRLPGGGNVGVLYSFDQDFADFSSDRFVLQPGEGLVIPTTNNTWAVYLSGWQYIYVRDDSDKPINPGNGIVDREGLGLFMRLGFADQDTNPVEFAFSAGLGGRGLIPSRSNDTFGVGYSYTGIQSDLITGLSKIENHTQGFEAYYSIAITPAARLTLDVQVVDSPSANLDTAVVLGMRLGLSF